VRLPRSLMAAVLLVVLVLAGGFAAARSAPDLEATGPTSVAGTEATAVFEVAERTVRQVRYADAGTLRYTFRVANRGRVPVTVLGLAPGQPDPRLFRLVGLTGPDGEATVEIGGGESAEVTLALEMGGCETLSSRSGSFVTDVRLRTSQAGLFEDEVLLILPEQLHTGSPREAFCPSSTATSRPPG
jgi:hypothetical protein